LKEEHQQYLSHQIRDQIYRQSQFPFQVHQAGQSLAKQLVKSHHSRQSLDSAAFAELVAMVEFVEKGASSLELLESQLVAFPLVELQGAELVLEYSSVALPRLVVHPSMDQA